MTKLEILNEEMKDLDKKIKKLERQLGITPEEKEAEMETLRKQIEDKKARMGDIEVTKEGLIQDPNYKDIETLQYVIMPSLKCYRQAEAASIIGDTVGDPLKDTSGPSLNILIKLSSIISVVFGSLFVSTSWLVN